MIQLDVRVLFRSVAMQYVANKRCAYPISLVYLADVGINLGDEAIKSILISIHSIALVVYVNVQAIQWANNQPDSREGTFEFPFKSNQ